LQWFEDPTHTLESDDAIEDSIMFDIFWCEFYRKKNGLKIGDTKISNQSKIGKSYFSVLALSDLMYRWPADREELYISSRFVETIDGGPPPSNHVSTDEQGRHKFLVGKY
jgi:hypothetical protein